MPLLTPHVPNGLIDIMKDLAKEVLRDKPENIYEFAAIHFEKLILERDGSMDKGYEQFSASEAYFDGQQRFAVSSKSGYICQRPIKIQPLLQARKSKSDIMASFQAMESINEEDIMAPVPAEGPYADEKYQKAIYVIQRYFRRYVAKKKNLPSNTLSAFTAAIIIQRTMRRLFSNKIQLKRDVDKGSNATTTTAVKLVQDDMDNVSEAASYTSSSTIQMLADGQEGRENRLASGQRQQREDGSDGDGDVDGVVGAAEFVSMEFKEPSQQEEPQSTSATTVVAVYDDDEEHSLSHSHSHSVVVAVATEMDRKSIADENGNIESTPTEATILAPTSAIDDASTAHIGILSAKIGSNSNHQNPPITNNFLAIDRNRSEPTKISTKQTNVIPAGLVTSLNYHPPSLSFGAPPDTLPATSPHLEETQETFVVQRLQENANGKNNDALTTFIQGECRIRKYDNDTGEPLKMYDVFQPDMNDTEYSDSLNESTMEKDSLEPEELDADSLESNENVVHHASEIVKRDTRQDESSLYGDKDADDEEQEEDGDGDDAQNVQKITELERVPTYLYGIHPVRTPIVQRRNKGRNSEEERRKVPEVTELEAAVSIQVENRTPDEKSEEESLESKESTSEESSVTQIENNFEKTRNGGNRLKVAPDKDEIQPKDLHGFQKEQENGVLDDDLGTRNDLRTEDIPKDSNETNPFESSTENGSSASETEIEKNKEEEGEVPDKSVGNDSASLIDMKRKQFHHEELSKTEVLTKAPKKRPENFALENKISSDLLNKNKDHNGSAKSDESREGRESSHHQSSQRKKRSLDVNALEAALIEDNIGSDNSKLCEESSLFRNDTKKLNGSKNLEKESSTDKNEHSSNKTNEDLPTSSSSNNHLIVNSSTVLETNDNVKEKPSDHDQEIESQLQELLNLDNLHSSLDKVDLNDPTAGDSNNMEDLQDLDGTINQTQEKIERTSNQDLQISLTSEDAPINSIDSETIESADKLSKTSLVVPGETTVRETNISNIKAGEGKGTEDETAELQEAMKSEDLFKENDDQILKEELEKIQQIVSDCIGIKEKGSSSHRNEDKLKTPILKNEILDSNDEEMKVLPSTSIEVDKIISTLQVSDKNPAEQLTTPDNEDLKKSSNSVCITNTTFSEIIDSSEAKGVLESAVLDAFETELQQEFNNKTKEEKLQQSEPLKKHISDGIASDGDIGGNIEDINKSSEVLISGKVLSSASTSSEQFSREIEDSPNLSNDILKPENLELTENSGSADFKNFSDTTNEDTKKDISASKHYQMTNICTADKPNEEGYLHLKITGIEDSDNGKPDSELISENILTTSKPKEAEFFQLRTTGIEDSNKEKLDSKTISEIIFTADKPNEEEFLERKTTEIEDSDEGKLDSKALLENITAGKPNITGVEQGNFESKIVSENIITVDKSDGELLRNNPLNEGIQNQSENEILKNKIEKEELSHEINIKEEQRLNIGNEIPEPTALSIEPDKRNEEEVLDIETQRTVNSDGSSAETSADCSEITKDLEFYEDTIQYLKNATEHLGKLDGLFNESPKSVEAPRERDALGNSALVIQSAYRGYQVRKDLKQPNMENIFKEQNEADTIREKRSLDKKEEKLQAAIKIQSAFRGHSVRKTLKEELKKTPESIENEPALSKEPQDPISPSKGAFGSIYEKTHIPVAVIHPTKYLPSSDKVSKSKSKTSSENGCEVTSPVKLSKTNPKNTGEKPKIGNKNVKTMNSPQKKVPVIRQKQLENKPAIKSDSSDENNKPTTSQKDDTYSLDQTVKMESFLVLAKKTNGHGNKSKNFKTKTQSTANLLEHTQGSTKLREQFARKGKSVSTNGRFKKQESFDLEAIKKDLLSGTIKTLPPTSNKNKEGIDVKGGKHKSPKKQSKETKIPQKTQSKISNVSTKSNQASDNSEVNQSSTEVSTGEIDLSKTFSIQMDHLNDRLLDSTQNELSDSSHKKSLMKTYTVRSSLNEIGNLEEQVEKGPKNKDIENSSGEPLDSLENNENKLEANIQEKSAVKIQKTFRGYKTRKNLKSVIFKDFNSNETHNDLMRQAKEASQEKAGNTFSNTQEVTFIGALNDTQTGDKEEAVSNIDYKNSTTFTKLSDPALDKAAINIQKSYRGYSTRKKLKTKRVDDKIEGRDSEPNLTRNHEKSEHFPGKKEPDNISEEDFQTPDLEKSATMIQKTFRGYKSRKQYKPKKITEIAENQETHPKRFDLIQDDENKNSEHHSEETPSIFDNLKKSFDDYKTSVLDKSATTIQKHFRGYSTRKTLKTNEVIKNVRSGIVTEAGEEINRSEENYKTPAFFARKPAEKSSLVDLEKSDNTKVFDINELPTKEESEKRAEPTEDRNSLPNDIKDSHRQKPGIFDSFDVEKFHNAALQNSATTIQKTFKGYKTRKELLNSKKKDEIVPSLDKPADEISKSYESSHSNKELNEDHNQTVAQLKNSATTIQKTFRGYKTRKELFNLKKEGKTVPNLDKRAEDISSNENSHSIKESNEDHNQTVAQNSITESNGIDIEQPEEEEKLSKTTHSENMESLQPSSEDHTSINTVNSNEDLQDSKIINTSQVELINREHQESSSEFNTQNDIKTAKSSSAGAVLENAASTIQKAYRDYNARKNNICTNFPMKSYSNGTQRETTPKEVLENSDESSTFIGPDTSFDLSDVESVETKIEKTFNNYDKLSSSEAHTPVNNTEEGVPSTISINIHSEDHEIDNDCTNIPEKFRRKRSIMEPTAPPLETIVKTEEGAITSPKLQWFVGDEPIIPSDSSLSNPPSPFSASSVNPLVAASSKFEDFSSVDACRKNLTTPSAVVSASSLLITNLNQMNDRNTLNNNSGIVSAKEEGNLEKEGNNFKEIDQSEDIVGKLEKEDNGAVSEILKTTEEFSKEPAVEAEDKKEDNTAIVADLCKNCAEGIHVGGICSGDLIKNHGDDVDYIKEFVLIEDQHPTNIKSTVIAQNKEEKPVPLLGADVISSNAGTSLDNRSPPNEIPTHESKTSNDCPAISLIPPSSEDDSAERDSSHGTIRKDDGGEEDIRGKGKESVTSKTEEQEIEKQEAITKTEIETGNESVGNDVDTNGNSAVEASNANTKIEEIKTISSEEVFESLVGKTQTNELLSDSKLHTKIEEQSSSSSKHEEPQEDAFKTLPGEELEITDTNFEDDFSKNTEEISKENQLSTELKNEDKVIEEDIKKETLKNEESKMEHHKENTEGILFEENKLDEDSRETRVKENIQGLDMEKSSKDLVFGTSENKNLADITKVLTKEESTSSPSSFRLSEEIGKIIKEIHQDENKDQSIDLQNESKGFKTSDKAEYIISKSKEINENTPTQEDIEIAAKLIESNLSDIQTEIVDSNRKLDTNFPSKEENTALHLSASSNDLRDDHSDTQIQAKIEKLIEDHLKPIETTSNTIDPKDLPTEDSSQEVVELPCVKKVLPPTPYSASSDPEESELESTTTKAESTTTTPGYDDASETDAIEIPASKPDVLDAMTEKIRETEAMVARMQQRRASEHKISIESATDQPIAFEEPICEPIKSMQQIQKSSSTEAEDEFVLQKLQRGDTTRESSAQSESVVIGDSTSQLTESEDTFNENMGLHQKPPSHLFKSVTIDDTVKYIDPEKSTEESGGSFCMDDALSEDVRKKMLAYSVSEADSDYYDIGDQSSHPHDDFNISTALDNFPSADTDTTIISAATKIQAGARGFLTRRRIRRASMGTKASLTEEQKMSFGNDAIGESLDQLAEEEIGKRQFNRQTGVNSLPSTLEHSDETNNSLSPQAEDIQTEAVTSAKHSSTNIDREMPKVSTASQNDVNDGIEKQADDSTQAVSNLEATVARRLTLQRGDALRNDSTPDDENGNGKQVELVKNSSSDMGSLLIHEKTMVESTTTTTTRTTTERRNYSDAAVSTKKDKIKWFAMRQNSMPVQIDSEVFRVLPKHMRKRIKSAEGEKPKRIRLPRD